MSRIVAALKPTFHLTISMREKRAKGRIQRNDYHDESCGPSLTSKVLFIWRQSSPGTRAGPLCRDLTFTKNSIALLIMFYLLFI